MSRDVVATNVGVDDVEWKTVEEFYDFSGGKGSSPTSGGLVHLLSQDPDTGATTTLLKLPAGWQTPAGMQEKHTYAQEEILLSGELSFNGVDFRAPAYISMPGAVVHGPGITKTECVLLAICYGPFDVTYVKA